MAGHIPVSFSCTTCSKSKETEQRNNLWKLGLVSTSQGLHQLCMTKYLLCLRVSFQQLETLCTILKNIHGLNVGLPINSLMASKDLLQHLVWPCVYTCVCNSSKEGEYICLYLSKRTSTQSTTTRNPQERNYVIHQTVSLSLNTILLCPTAQKEKCKRKQDLDREGQVVTEPCSSHHWHHSD